MISGFLAPDFLGDHVWQSTVFAAVAALLTLLFRRNHARIRYSLWAAASIKFLVPFSLLIALGSSIDFDGRKPSPAGPPAGFVFVESVSQPFGSSTFTNAVSPAVKQARFPSAITSIYVAWIFGSVAVFLLYLARGLRIRGIVRRAEFLREGRAYEMLRKLESSAGTRKNIKLAVTPSSMEPGVFGIFRPVLLLPAGMPDRLGDSELEAIIAHEITHVRRRDNLVSALHMLIEALFWFHPMIWWLGAKLVQERERACDEEVLRLGKDPQAYAEGILKVCEFYLESPLPCVAGVTGADMKKRIQAIMMHRIGGRLGVAKKLLLGIAAVIALSVPVTIGLLSTQQGRAQSGVDTAQAPQSRIPAAVPAAGVPNDQSEPVPFLAQISAIAAIPPQQPADTRSTGPSFEVASVKPTQQCGQVFSSGSGPARSTMVIGKPSFQAGGLYSGCGNLASLIREAYKLDYPFQLSGGPGWKDSDQFQIEAKAEGEPSTDQMRLMVQSLLAERFKLKIHTEMRETQGYSLVVAEGGPRLQQAKDENGNLMTALPPPEVIEAKRKAAMSTPMDFSKMKGGVSTLPGTWGVMGTVKNPPEVVMQFHGSAITLDGLAKFLSGQVGRIVANRTGIPGLYDFQMQFTMDAGTSGNMILVSPAGISRRPTGAPVVAGGEILPAPQFSGPNIFKALEEQYGLKLETGKAPCEYFIIDSAEKPTEN